MRRNKMTEPETAYTKLSRPDLRHASDTGKPTMSVKKPVVL
jgi:hypothetical protein